MSLSHYFELSPERYMRTYYGFPTFYTCVNGITDIPHQTRHCDKGYYDDVREPSCMCPDHIDFMNWFVSNQQLLNR